MVAPETETGAPAASDRTFWASSRRLPIFGRGPTTCTAMLPISKPALAHDPGGLRQQGDAGGAGPLGAAGAEVLRRGRRGRRRRRARCRRRGRRRPRRSGPARPVPSPSHFRPAHHSSRPSSKAWMSVPMPTCGQHVAGGTQKPSLSLLRARTASARTRSSGRVTLKASSWPGTATTVRAELLDHARVVGDVVGDRLVGADEGVAVEALRGLHGAQPGALRGGDDRLRLARGRGGLDLLDGVRERQRRDDGGGAVPYGLDDGVDRVDRDERAGGVVDEDDVVSRAAARRGRASRTPGGSRRRGRPGSRSARAARARRAAT